MARIVTIAVVAGSITAVVAAAAVVGIDMPKLATQSYVNNHALEELERFNILAGSAQSTRIIALQNAISADERRAGDLEIQAIQLEKLNQNARPIRDQIRRLHKSIRNNETELQKLRN